MTAESPRPGDAAALAGAKSILRRAVLVRRAARAANERAAQDQARTALLVEELRTRRPRLVAAYLSSGDEPDTLRLVAWLAAHDIPVLLPVLSAGVGAGSWRTPAWARYQGPDALRVGPFSILEPTGEVLPAGALSPADLVICPGLAATVRGERLGRGGGWYDRALAHAGGEAAVVVLLNDGEVLDVLPVEDHDRRVNLIITPTRRLVCDQRISNPARD